MKIVGANGSSEFVVNKQENRKRKGFLRKTKKTQKRTRQSTHDNCRKKMETHILLRSTGIHYFLSFWCVIFRWLSLTRNKSNCFCILPTRLWWLRSNVHRFCAYVFKPYTWPSLSHPRRRHYTGDVMNIINQCNHNETRGEIDNSTMHTCTQTTYKYGNKFTKRPLCLQDVKTIILSYTRGGNYCRPAAQTAAAAERGDYRRADICGISAFDVNILWVKFPRWTRGTGWKQTL